MSMSPIVGLYSDKNFCSGCKPHIRIVIVGLDVEGRRRAANADCLLHVCAELKGQSTVLGRM